MSFTRYRWFTLLLLCGALQATSAVYGSTVKTSNVPQPVPQAKPPSNATYPQIVRLSYVEGDVRISRGKVSEKISGSAWETAVADLSIESGFSIVTGAGRAEIEFEDTSVAYLGENSALLFNDLHTTSGIPYTSLALLAGTATMDVRRIPPGAYLTVATPTDKLELGRSYVRVNSYRDAMAVTLMSRGVNEGQPPVAGKTAFYRDGRPIEAMDAMSPGEFTAWDNWVADRVAKRSAAMAEVMKVSGLEYPIPGLADLAGRGTFSPCAPYGTCWEPKPPSAQQSSGEASDTQAPATASAKTPPTSQSGNSPATEQILTVDFPCMDYFLSIERDSQSGQLVMRRLTRNILRHRDWSYPAWATCHAGSWIYRQNHYIWVVEHRPHRHHRPPVRWIKNGRTVAYVPIHPHDVSGALPVNRKHEVFAVKGESVEKVNLDGSHPIELLSSPPKEFRRPPYSQLSPAKEPSVQVKTLAEVHSRSDAATAWLKYDHKTQRFMLAKQVTQGSKSFTTLEAFSGVKGSLQVKSGGVDAHGNYVVRPGAGSGPSSGGRSSGGSSSGALRSSGGGQGGGSTSSGGHQGGGVSSGGGGGAATTKVR
jgi:hypothetical protein